MSKLSSIKAFARVAKQTLIKYSPEILMGLGGVTFVATVVAASKETVKEQEILEDHRCFLEQASALHDIEAYDDKAYKRTRFDAYKTTIVDTTVNYAPAIILGTTSLACFFGAFGIMKKRYATLVVAYSALEESFRKYRERVVADHGQEADLYYLTGSKVKEITVKDEDGNKTKQKQLILPDGTIASPYAFKFGKYKENGKRNNQWTEDSMLLMAYAMGQQDYLNNQLYSRCLFDRSHKVLVRGSVMLNEIRDLLGEDPTSTGAIVGNRFGNGEPGCNGFVDFGIIEAKEKDPDTGKDIPCLFINPNVDGMIYDLLGKKEEIPFTPSYGEWGEDVSV